MAIQTVLGAIAKEQLGVTSSHEHIYIDLTGFYEDKPSLEYNTASDKVEMHNLGVLRRDPYALRDNLMLDDEADQVRELARFKRAGGNSIVDVTNTGINRQPQRLREAALLTGLNVICATGYYVGATHDAWTMSASKEEIADRMIRELREGIEDTGIRAGIIGELGVSEWFTASERKVLRAGALAHRATGAPVMVHINPWTDYGVEAARILLDGGVRPEKICICHVDVENRRPYIRALLQLGVYVEFDNFGKEFYVAKSARRLGYGCFVSDEERVVLLGELLGAGHEGQLLLSCDVCLKMLLHEYGGWGYGHVLENIRPMLLEEGVTQEQLTAMLVKNPADYLDIP